MKSAQRELALLGAILVLGLLPLFGVPGFYTVANLRNLALDNVPVLVTAIGMTAVIIVAEIDISVGSVFVVCGALAGLTAQAGLPMPLVVATTLGAGALFGAVNGLLVAWARVPSIIATLGTMAILRNGIIHATGGAWIQNLPPGFQWFGLGQNLAQPVYLMLALALVVAGVWTLRQTSLGRSLYAVGCDRVAARRVGLNPPAIILAAFVLLGTLTAMAALFNFTRYPTIETNAGVGFELQVIAAVVVGGTAVTGGRGNLLGTLLGVVLLGMIGTVLTFLHINPAWAQAIEGLIILAAVVSDTAFGRDHAHD
ncbi:ABC transporter permease [Horticoccus luteus]|uniref:Autoinducer 2 import system permease protein LsrC n=1 Tax=Horticoccus luteus TaxID=2862869 RepID=A0A8F9TRA7_9BACT|nr:ABC transporter permease [Horticoccus luteus]QYM77744.1 ABC transporter permease [Horticoccus luteus]